MNAEHTGAKQPRPATFSVAPASASLFYRKHTIIRDCNRINLRDGTGGDFLVGKLCKGQLCNAHLAFFGWEQLWYSTERHRGFQDRAAEADVDSHALLRPWNEAPDWARRIETTVHWLSSLPLPCGIFAAQDFQAQLLLDACNEAGLRVPEDIAIVGMDNNETICEHSVPTLSSIALNSKLVGYQAAKMLHRIILGEPCRQTEELIPPDRVVARNSSDMLYCADPLVREAIETMRRHIRKNVNIQTIADALNISKRKLERRFAQFTGSSPHRYLSELRIHHGQAFMQRNPQAPMEAVAAECGFGSAASVYAAFQRINGIPPSSFRAAVKSEP